MHKVESTSDIFLTGKRIYYEQTILLRKAFECKYIEFDCSQEGIFFAS